MQDLSICLTFPPSYCIFYSNESLEQITKKLSIKSESEDREGGRYFPYRSIIIINFKVSSKSIIRGHNYVHHLVCLPDLRQAAGRSAHQGGYGWGNVKMYDRKADVPELIGQERYQRTVIICLTGLPASYP